MASIMQHNSWTRLSVRQSRSPACKRKRACGELAPKTRQMGVAVPTQRVVPSEVPALPFPPRRLWSRAVAAGGRRPGEAGPDSRARAGPGQGSGPQARQQAPESAKGRVDAVFAVGYQWTRSNPSRYMNQRRIMPCHVLMHVCVG